MGAGRYLGEAPLPGIEFDHLQAELMADPEDRSPLLRNISPVVGEEMLFPVDTLLVPVWS